MDSSSSSPPLSAEAAAAKFTHLESAVSHLLQQQEQLSKQKRESKLKAPKMEPFSGLIGAHGFPVESWLRLVEKQFVHLAREYGTPSDAEKIQYAALWLTGDAQTWWENEVKSASAANQPVKEWSTFVDMLRKRYHPMLAEETARHRLRALTQRGKVNTYCNEFLQLIAQIKNLDEATKIFDFRHGLVLPIAAKVAEMHPKTLQEAMAIAVQVEQYVGRGGNHFGFRSSSSASSSFYPRPSASSSTSVPMDINSIQQEELEEEPAQSSGTGMESVVLAKLEAMEQRLNAMYQNGNQNRRPRSGMVPGLSSADIADMMRKGQCFRCKKTGHMKNECPQNPAAKRLNA
jgi:hypothetical protein